MKRYLPLILAILACVLSLGRMVFGFSPNDDGDDTADLQAWIDRQSQQDAPAEELPPGRYLISDTLDVVRTQGLRLAGARGMARSASTNWGKHLLVPVLEWTGEPNKPMLHLRLSGGTVIEGIAFTGPASTAIQINHNGGALHFQFNGLLFNGQDVGICWGSTVRENTCANATYLDCVWLHQQEAAVRTVNEQSLEHLFLRPQFNRCAVAIDVQAGGDVSVMGGGSYELETLLLIGNGGSNVRGFDVASFRFDSHGETHTRTAWLEFRGNYPRTVGPVSFRNCTLVTNSRESDKPLLTIVPGAHVVLDACTVNGSVADGEMATIHSTGDRQGTLVVRDSDGFGQLDLAETVQTMGPQSYYAFERTGGVQGRRSLSTFPDDIQREELLDMVKTLQEKIQAARAALE